MSTVKSALAQKRGALTHVRSGDMVVEALRQMRENRVRSVLVIDDDVLVGIVTQGDCAIKVLLPGLDAKQTPVGQVMTANPVTVKPDDRLEGCMAMMAARGFRHLPVLDAGKVVGVISIGDVVKNIIRDLEHNVGDLMGYIMRDGPGGLTDEPRCRPVRDLGYRRQQPKPEPRSVADPYGLPACNCGLASSSIFAGSRSI